jgi:hypothetical protein
MYQHLTLLLRCWLYATISTLVLFGALFHFDQHPMKGDWLFMLQAMAAVVMLSIPGIILYALLCVGLAMLGVPPYYQLAVRLISAWIYCWPFLGMAAMLLRLQSLGFATIAGVSIGIIWHWNSSRYGITLQSPNTAS